MKLVESILTKNPCYTAGRTITVKGLMLHSVGCSQPSALAFIKNWNSPSFDRACVHGFIDGNDGTVYQTLPWNYRGWHCGSSINGSANNTHIGVEMCEPACITYTGGATFKCSDIATAKAVAERTYKAAVELFAMLCNEFGLDPLADGVVISHKEGHARGIASNHGDPEHLWSQLGMGYTIPCPARENCSLHFLLLLRRQRQRASLQMRNGQFKRDLKEENQTRVSFALVMIGTLKQRALPSTKRKVNGSSIFMNSILAGLPLKG